ncbi:hypothetical protein [Prosthecobacter sp.]|uniref:hypothetical protein n=1 Tax=Prosthecobacter sp. TaxID=1965333 RepID=UPI00378437A4
MYARDHDATYPDKKETQFHSANQVFRELFREEIINDERIFGCTASPFNPDRDIGQAPLFDRALTQGECHWMLLKGQSRDSHPKTPIVIENSLTPGWPPKWSLNARGTRGSAWPNRKIVIGRNDGSVAVERLREDGTMDWHSPGNLGPDGKSWIDTLTPEQLARLSYWDIEEK